MMKINMTKMLLGAALAIAWSCAPALGATLFGSLSNFDVVNDTGSICRGFEIELEGVSPPDIAFTFGAPYIRYGDPVVVPNAGGTGTIVRYASAFTGGAWATGTQIPSGPFPTGGHQCFYPASGGDPNYETLGGEHFGVALNGNPTNTTYRWLLGDDVGNLIATGSNVKIPAPVWNVQPAANPVVAPAAVQAVIPALPKEHPEDEFGEALWVKVFVIEAGEPIELDDLLLGDPAVPSEPAEIEIEWQLLQAGKNGGDELDSGLDDMAADSESISRRYEFYSYIGPYNSEGEAQFEDPEDPAIDPILYPNGIVGDFIGAQNAALNLAPFVPEPSAVILLGVGLASVAASRRRRRRGAVA